MITPRPTLLTDSRNKSNIKVQTNSDVILMVFLVPETYFARVLKSNTDTASFTTPSPNKIEFRVG